MLSDHFCTFLFSKFIIRNVILIKKKILSGLGTLAKFSFIIINLEIEVVWYFVNPKETS